MAEDLAGSSLTRTVTAAMTRGGGELVVFDLTAGRWRAHPWSEVHDVSMSMAVVLVEQADGGERSGPVAIIGEPIMETVAAIHGAWLAGRSVMFLPGPGRSAADANWAARTFARIQEIGCTTVLGHGEVLAELNRFGGHDFVTDLEHVRQWQARGSLPLKPDREAPCLFQGTAGSTGEPRTVMLRTDAVLNNVRALKQRLRFDGSRDVICSWLPLYHDMGLMMLVSGLVTGATTWLAPTAAFRRSPLAWLNWLTDSRATLTAAPHFAYNLMARYARRASGVDLGRLQIAINGGEPIDPDGLERFAAAFEAAGFDRGAMSCSYGMAEATCAVTVPDRGTGFRTDDIVVSGNGSPPKRNVLLGQPLEGVRLRYTESETSTELDGLREVGEVELRSTALMSGYAGTCERYAEGDWLSTGDVGYEIDGQLVVCGRTKELITLAGRNVFPQEVEASAAKVRGVAPGGVVAVGAARGRSAARTTELVIAAEYRGSDEKAVRRAIIEHVAAECGVVPSVVDLLSPGALPKTTSGKLRRLQVRSWYE